jgi:mono/diheme cytochrome c family protein
LLLAGGAVAFAFLTQPETIAPAAIPKSGDPENGAYMFYAGGCASCHAAPGAKGEAQLQLGGGLALKTPFGTFYPPNISPDETHGIGGWSTADFVNAMVRGVAPDGSHLYPSFPYTSYAHMTLQDVVDVKAFIDTLPAVADETPAHDLPLPFRWRRPLGLWKLLYLDSGPLAPIAGADAEVERGAYLVNGPGHCGECHTPRNLIGGPEADWAFSGAPDPSDDGYVPNITPSPDGIGDWTVKDVATALKTGLLPDYDTFGGTMVEVQENMARLTDADRQAIGAYLLSLPPKDSPWKKKPAGAAN